MKFGTNPTSHDVILCQHYSGHDPEGLLLLFRLGAVAVIIALHERNIGRPVIQCGKYINRNSYPMQNGA